MQHRTMDRFRRADGTFPPLAGADGEDPAPPQAGDPPPTDDPKKDPPADDPKKDPPWGSDEQFDPARAWKLVQDLRGDLDKVKGDRDQLRTKVQTHEDASKTDHQKLEERATDGESRAVKAEAEVARLRVALRKGLSETQAKRLVGDDEEALEKDADELLASFRTEDDPGGDAQRRPRERLRPGAVPTSEPDDNDPRKLADGVGRRGW